MTELSPGELSALGAAMRAARAELKAEIARGSHSVVELFDRAGEPHCDVVLAGLRVSWFLRSIPGIGVTKTSRLLEGLGINPRATLGGLRVRQRSVLRPVVAQLQRTYLPQHRGVLVVLVGPTAVGKGTIVSWITAGFPDFVVSVSATTRLPRPGERDGVHYYFVSDEEFDELVRDKRLLEWARVHGGHRYGTPGEQVEALLDVGKNVILEIDIQGFRQVQKRMGKKARVMSVFIEPPSFEELTRRLSERGTESPEAQRQRLVTARAELDAKDECDFVVVNDEVHRAGQSIVDLAGGFIEPIKL